MQDFIYSIADAFNTSENVVIVAGAGIIILFVCFSMSGMRLIIRRAQRFCAQLLTGTVMAAVVLFALSSCIAKDDEGNVTIPQLEQLTVLNSQSNQILETGVNND